MQELRAGREAAAHMPGVWQRDSKWKLERGSLVFDLTHGLQPGRLNVDVDGDVRASSSRYGAVPMLLARREDDCIARVDILSGLTLSLDADSALDDEQPLRT